jgi:hypothetical protein
VSSDSMVSLGLATVRNTGTLLASIVFATPIFAVLNRLQAP